VESFAARMGAIFELSDGRLDEMGRAARARAERFTWNDFVERIDEHVEELTASRRAVLV